MNGAPRWIHNVELWYRPSFIKGLRTGMEWQQQGSYYMDALNTMKYKGFDVLHFRAGYQWKAFEVWINVMNITDSYYSYISSKSGASYSYTPADPRHLNIGFAYDFGKILANNNVRRNR
jgi:hypothetical protein